MTKMDDSRIADGLKRHARSMAQEATSDLDVMFGPEPWVEGIKAERTFTLPDGRRIVLRLCIDLEDGSPSHEP